MKRTTGLLSALTAAGLLFPVVSHSQQKTAVLISVAKYRHSDGKRIVDLGYSVNQQFDLKRMSEELKPLGFTMPITMQDQAATREKIEAALNDIAAKAKPKDTIVLYFSGHGAYGKNEFHLCPYDALTNSGESDVSEGFLKAWLDKLPTRNVTLILDCCFTPKLDRADSSIRVEKYVGRPDDQVDKGDNQQVHIDPAKAVVLTAAGQNGCAYQELKFPIAKAWIGLFTYYLCEELHRARNNPETTFRQILERVQEKIRRDTNPTSKGDEAKFPRQSPDLYGAAELVDRPLFAEVKTPAAAPKTIDPGETQTPAIVVPRVDLVPPIPPKTVPPYLKITDKNADKIALDQGKNQGVTVGSQYDIFPSGETDFKPEHKLGTVRVSSVSPEGASGKLLADAKAATISKDCRAILSHNVVDVKTNSYVQVRLKGAPAFQTKMTQALTQFPVIKVAADAATPADLVIDGDLSGTGVKATLWEPSGKDPASVSSSGQPTEFTADTAEALVKKISGKLSAIAMYHAVEKLDNPNPGIHITLKSAANTNTFVEGGPGASFLFTTDRDCYLFVFAVDADGYPELLSPYNGETNFVKANSQKLIPSDSHPIQVYPPYGNVRLLAVALTDAKKAQELQNSLNDFAASGGADANRGRSLKIPDAVQSLQSSPVSGWAKCTLDIFTMPKQQEESRKPQ